MLFSPWSDPDLVCLTTLLTVQELTSDDQAVFEKAFLTYIANPFPAVSRCHEHDTQQHHVLAASFKSKTICPRATLH